MLNNSSLCPQKGAFDFLRDIRPAYAPNAGVLSKAIQPETENGVSQPRVGEQDRINNPGANNSTALKKSVRHTRSSRSSLGISDPPVSAITLKESGSIPFSNPRTLNSLPSIKIPSSFSADLAKFASKKLAKQTNSDSRGGCDGVVEPVGAATVEETAKCISARNLRKSDSDSDVVILDMDDNDFDEIDCSSFGDGESDSFSFISYDNSRDREKRKLLNESYGSYDGTEVKRAKTGDDSGIVAISPSDSSTSTSPQRHCGTQADFPDSLESTVVSENAGNTKGSILEDRAMNMKSGKLIRKSGCLPRRSCSRYSSRLSSTRFPFGASSIGTSGISYPSVSSLISMDISKESEKPQQQDNQISQFVTVSSDDVCYISDNSDRSDLERDEQTGLVFTDSLIDNVITSRIPSILAGATPKNGGLMGEIASLIKLSSNAAKDEHGMRGKLRNHRGGKDSPLSLPSTSSPASPAEFESDNDRLKFSFLTDALSTGSLKTDDGLSRTADVAAGDHDCSTPSDSASTSCPVTKSGWNVFERLVGSDSGKSKDNLVVANFDKSKLEMNKSKSSNGLRRFDFALGPKNTGWLKAVRFNNKPATSSCVEAEPAVRSDLKRKHEASPDSNLKLKSPCIAIPKEPLADREVLEGVGWNGSGIGLSSVLHSSYSRLPNLYKFGGFNKIGSSSREAGVIDVSADQVRVGCLLYNLVLKVSRKVDVVGGTLFNSTSVGNESSDRSCRNVDAAMCIGRSSCPEKSFSLRVSQRPKLAALWPELAGFRDYEPKHDGGFEPNSYEIFKSLLCATKPRPSSKCSESTTPEPGWLTVISLMTIDDSSLSTVCVCLQTFRSAVTSERRRAKENLLKWRKTRNDCREALRRLVYKVDGEVEPLRLRAIEEQAELERVEAERRRLEKAKRKHENRALRAARKREINDRKISRACLSSLLDQVDKKLVEDKLREDAVAASLKLKQEREFRERKRREKLETKRLRSRELAAMKREKIQRKQNLETCVSVLENLVSDVVEAVDQDVLVTAVAEESLRLARELSQRQLTHRAGFLKRRFSLIVKARELYCGQIQGKICKETLLGMITRVPDEHSPDNSLPNLSEKVCSDVLADLVGAVALTDDSANPLSKCEQICFDSLPLNSETLPIDSRTIHRHFNCEPKVECSGYFRSDEFVCSDIMAHLVLLVEDVCPKLESEYDPVVNPSSELGDDDGDRSGGILRSANGTGASPSLQKELLKSQLTFDIDSMIRRSLAIKSSPMRTFGIDNPYDAEGSHRVFCDLEAPPSKISRLSPSFGLDIAKFCDKNEIKLQFEVDPADTFRLRVVTPLIARDSLKTLKNTNYNSINKQLNVNLSIMKQSNADSPPVKQSNSDSSTVKQSNSDSSTMKPSNSASFAVNQSNSTSSAKQPNFANGNSLTQDANPQGSNNRYPTILHRVASGRIPKRKQFDGFVTGSDNDFKKDGSLRCRMANSCDSSRSKLKSNSRKTSSLPFNAKNLPKKSVWQSKSVRTSAGSKIMRKRRLDNGDKSWDFVNNPPSPPDPNRVYSKNSVENQYLYMKAKKCYLDWLEACRRSVSSDIAESPFAKRSKLINDKTLKSTKRKSNHGHDQSPISLDSLSVEQDSTNEEDSCLYEPSETSSSSGSVSPGLEDVNRCYRRQSSSGPVSGDAANQRTISNFNNPCKGTKYRGNSLQNKTGERTKFSSGNLESQSVRNNLTGNCSGKLISDSTKPKSTLVIWSPTSKSMQGARQSVLPGRGFDDHISGTIAITSPQLTCNTERLSVLSPKRPVVCPPTVPPAASGSSFVNSTHIGRSPQDSWNLPNQHDYSNNSINRIPCPPPPLRPSGVRVIRICPVRNTIVTVGEQNQPRCPPDLVLRTQAGLVRLARPQNPPVLVPCAPYSSASTVIGPSLRPPALVRHDQSTYPGASFRSSVCIPRPALTRQPFLPNQVHGGAIAGSTTYSVRSTIPTNSTSFRAASSSVACSGQQITSGSGELRTIAPDLYRKLNFGSSDRVKNFDNGGYAGPSQFAMAPAFQRLQDACGIPPGVPLSAEKLAQQALDLITRLSQNNNQLQSSADRELIIQQNLNDQLVMANLKRPP